MVYCERDTPALVVAAHKKAERKVRVKILRIKNRTENWKTAYYFAPFFRCEKARLRLAKELLARHEGKQVSDVDLGQGDININLFWYGMRDYFCPTGEREGCYKDAADQFKKPFAEHYKRLFPELYKEINQFKELSLNNKHNYDLSDVPDEDRKEKLFSNLFNTEIDIVLETPRHLFIGEAKHETGFNNANGQYVLVHQLIRQYVMANILVKHIDCRKKVIPFVVANDRYHTMNFGQVKFLLDQCWMSQKNILSWDCIKKLASGR